MSDEQKLALVTSMLVGIPSRHQEVVKTAKFNNPELQADILRISERLSNMSISSNKSLTKTQVSELLDYESVNHELLKLWFTHALKRLKNEEK